MREKNLYKEYKTLSNTLHPHLNLHMEYREAKCKLERNEKATQITYQVSESTKEFYTTTKQLLETEAKEINKLKDIYLELKEIRIYREWAVAYNNLISILGHITKLNEESYVIVQNGRDDKGRVIWKQIK